MADKKTSRMSAKRKNRIRQRNIRLAILACSVTVAVTGLWFGFLYFYVNQTDKDVVCDNIYVGSEDLSGLKKTEVEEIIGKQLESYRAQMWELGVGEESVSILLNDLGLDIKDVPALAEKAVRYGKEGSLWSRFKEIRKLKKEQVVLEETFVIDEELCAALISEQAVPLENRATDATISRVNGAFQITEEAPGTMINIEESLAAIEKFLNEEWDYQPAKVALVEEVEEPKVKAEDLKEIQDVLGSFWTEAGSGQRKNNLKRAAELLNGLVVMPGEEVSVEAVLKPFTADNGYVEAGAYQNGQVVQSMAGGICQVSTTLYNALLYAEVEIIERYAHSMTVNYVKPSRDAAIAEGSKDFKFRNNYDTPIYIQGSIDGSNHLQFYVYGKETRPEGRKVEYESEVVERVEHATKYVADSGSTLGAMKEEGSGVDKITARLWKVVTENGKEVSRKVWNNSYYRSSDVTVKVGVKSDNAEASNLVKNAIKTQDKAKIKEAISEANALISAASRPAETPENTETEAQTEIQEEAQTEG